MEITIAANNIVKSFGSKRVLDGISFNVHFGQIFGLLGPSDAGKTTLIKILTGQLDSDLGTAKINGTDDDKLTGEDNKKFGIMMDNFGIYDRLNCYENHKIFAEIYGVKKDRFLNALKKSDLRARKKPPLQSFQRECGADFGLQECVFMTDPNILFFRDGFYIY